MTNVGQVHIHDHVEVIAGEHKGDFSYIMGMMLATAQVITGNDTVYAVRKTSLCIMAHAINNPLAIAVGPGVPNPVAANLRPISLARLQHFMNHLRRLLPDHNDISVEEWATINLMICEHLYK